MLPFELRRNKEVTMEVIVASEPMDYEIRGMYRFATLREGSELRRPCATSGPRTRVCS